MEHSSSQARGKHNAPFLEYEGEEIDNRREKLKESRRKIGGENEIKL
jgi:hypothetical protein